MNRKCQKSKIAYENVILSSYIVVFGHATLPYVLRLAADPVAEVMSADPHFAAGVNVVFRRSLDGIRKDPIRRVELD